MIVYKIKTATQMDIYNHLDRCCALFIPPLSERVCITDFSKKIHTLGTTFEAWHEEKLIGLVSSYFNDRKLYHAYINNVSIEPDFMGKKITSKLIQICIEYAHEYGFKKIGLEVNVNNPNAIHLYKKFGFLGITQTNHTLYMEKELIKQGIENGS